MEELWWYKRTSGKHQKGTSSIYWQCCLVGQPRSCFSSPVLVLIGAGAKTQLLVHQEPSGETLVNADTPIWHKYQILVIVSGCDRRSQVWCSLIKKLLVLQQQQPRGGETLVRPKSLSRLAAGKAGLTSLAPPPLLPLLANFSTIRSFDGGGCPLVGGATRRGAGRNPSGGGWGGAMVGVGGWWGGRAPPRLIHPTTPPTEP